MKSAGKARSYGLYRHIRKPKEIIGNLLNDYMKNMAIIIIHCKAFPLKAKAACKSESILWLSSVPHLPEKSVSILSKR